MHGNAYYDALAAELDRIGGHGLRVENGSKHKRLVFSWGGREYFYPFPSHSRNKTAGRNAVRDLRRLLGIQHPVAHGGKRPGRKRGRHAERPLDPQPVQPPAAAPALSLTVLPDPWQVLAEFRPLSKDPAVRAMQQRIEARVQLALYRLSFHPGTLARWQRDCRRAQRRAYKQQGIGSADAARKAARGRA